MRPLSPRDRRPQLPGSLVLALSLSLSGAAERIANTKDGRPSSSPRRRRHRRRFQDRWTRAFVSVSAAGVGLSCGRGHAAPDVSARARQAHASPRALGAVAALPPGAGVAGAGLWLLDRDVLAVAASAGASAEAGPGAAAAPSFQPPGARGWPRGAAAASGAAARVAAQGRHVGAGGLPARLWRAAALPRAPAPGRGGHGQEPRGRAGAQRRPDAGGGRPGQRGLELLAGGGVSCVVGPSGGAGSHGAGGVRSGLLREPAVRHRQVPRGHRLLPATLHRGELRLQGVSISPPARRGAAHPGRGLQLRVGAASVPSRLRPRQGQGGRGVERQEALRDGSLRLPQLRPAREASQAEPLQQETGLRAELSGDPRAAAVVRPAAVRRGAPVVATTPEQRGGQMSAARTKGTAPFLAPKIRRGAVARRRRGRYDGVMVSWWDREMETCSSCSRELRDPQAFQNPFNP
eukprot:scaffold8172_cov248-Pinguiococcus_pyrenoidosus.AAC.2